MNTCPQATYTWPLSYSNCDRIKEWQTITTFATVTYTPIYIFFNSNLTVINPVNCKIAQFDCSDRQQTDTHSQSLNPAT